LWRVHRGIMWEGRISPRMDVVRHHMLAIRVGRRAIRTFMGRRKVLPRRVIDRIVAFWCVLCYRMDSSCGRCR